MFTLLKAVSVLLIVQFHDFQVLHEVELSHRLDYVFSIDCLPLLDLCDLARFTGDECDEFGDTFLHALSRLLRYFGVVGQRLLHDTIDVSDWQEPLLVNDALTLVLLVATLLSLAFVCLIAFRTLDHRINYYKFTAIIQ